ncbi:MAG: thiol:disulfide interchange protein DsbA/DsbL [Steroidobacteraceae bacterium]
MKRISVAALGLTLLMAVTGCGNNAPDGGVTGKNDSATTSAPVSVAETAATASNQAPAVAEEPVAGEQVTETGGSAESMDTDSTTAQPLALRITEMQAEPASQWKEGVHYSRLLPAQPTGAIPGQVEVTEVFWYGCPHCYALDSYLENWRKNGKAAYISFVRVPVMWGAIHHMHARLYYTAELLGKLEELHTPIFEEIHRNHNPLASAASIESFFTSHGVSQADFQKAFSSFAVEASLKHADMLGLRYKVESVPLIVINGKYVTDVGRAGGQQQLLALINELASREHGI